MRDQDRDGGIATNDLPQGVLDASNVLKALAHPARLMIVGHLLDGEKSVGEIERDLVLRQPSLSQQLRQLREAGVVATRREAKSVFYRLNDDRAATLMREIAAIFGDTATRPQPVPAAQPRSRPVGDPPCAPRRVASGGECAMFPIAGRNADRR